MFLSLSSKKWTVLGALLVFAFTACLQLPKEKLSQFEMDVFRELRGDSLVFQVSNPLQCPLEFELQSSNALIKAAIQSEPLFILQPQEGLLKKWQIDTLTLADTSNFAEQLAVDIRFTATDFTENRPAIELPFPLGHSYRIMQGYHGKFSHNSDFSAYALDFALSVGDTVCAAADGYVVGLIDGYTKGGNSRKLRPYANYLTLYHPAGEFYTQYVHLQYQGALVEINQTVQAGQAIGLSGETGFTSKAHLHFNVLQPRPGQSAISAPINFVEGYQGHDLQENDWVKKPN